MSRDGIHFFDRQTGVNVLFDEVSVPSDLLHVAPRFVSIALTNRCDLKCDFCYAPKNRHELSFEQLKLWLTELDRNGCLGVGFGGGEPTLHPRLSLIHI